jgi:hypothetical protein
VETELQELSEVRQLSTYSLHARYPQAGRIIRAIIREKSLKHHTKPWSGPLPRPRISPPRTLGDAVIKNSYLRLKGGRLMPQSFKMALPSMIQESASNSVHG